MRNVTGLLVVILVLIMTTPFNPIVKNPFMPVPWFLAVAALWAYTLWRMTEQGRS